MTDLQRLIINAAAYKLQLLILLTSCKSGEFRKNNLSHAEARRTKQDELTSRHCASFQLVHTNTLLSSEYFIDSISFPLLTPPLAERSVIFHHVFASGLVDSFICC